MRKAKKILILPLLIILLIVMLNAVYTVQENEYAYITRFSKYMGMRDSAGVAFKVPILDNVIKIPKYRMEYDIPPSDVLTGDKKTLVVDNFAVWKIDDPLTFMRSVGSVREMENRIDASVYNAVKNILGTMEQTDIINSDKGSVDIVNQKITDAVNIQLKNYGVSIIAAEIKRLDLPGSNEEAVYNRMISERKQMAESYLAEGKLEANKLRNETDKEVSIVLSKADAEAEKLRGEGEAEYMRILSEAYSTPERQDYYQFVRNLDALEKSLDGDKTIFLSADSHIAKVLNNIR